MSLLDKLEGDADSQRWIKDHFDYPHTEWCLIWPFGLNQGGYANFGRDGTIVSRVMCEHKNGPAPADRPYATHNCGKGSSGCVNPHHLEWKTHGEFCKQHGKRAVPRHE